MSLQTPTTQDVSDNFIAQLQSELNQTIPLAPKSFLRVLAKVVAGIFILLYKYCGFTAQQLFVRSASSSPTVINGMEITPLNEWGKLVGAGSPFAAVHAEVAISFDVVQVGATLPAGTQLIGDTNGVVYITQFVTVMNASVWGVVVTAVADQAGGNGAGVIGNLDPGDTLSFVNPLSTVGRTATVLGVTVAGAEGETSADYRQRILDRFQKRPQGGAYTDYQRWGTGVVGVSAIYPYTGVDPGTVEIYVEAKSLADGIPNEALLTAVEDAVNYDSEGLASRRPVGALVEALAITRTSFVVTVAGLAVDNIADVQVEITAAVEQYFLEREPFIVGLSALPRRDRITGTGVSAIVEDIVDAAGGVFTNVTVSEDGSPVTLYTLGKGEKAKAGSVVYS